MTSSKNTIKMVQTMEELDAELKVLPESSYHIVFNNTVSKLEIGKREVAAAYFPSILYTEHTVLALPENAPLSQEDFQRKLEDELSAGVVTFLKPEKEVQASEKDFQFINSGHELAREMYDRVDWQDDICTYYPKMKGKLTINHVLETGEMIPIREKRFQGMIDFRDKILGLTFPANHRDIYNLLWEEGIYPEYNWDVECPYEKQSVSQDAK